MFSAITTLHRPLSQGNRLQRACARWAAPHYLRVEPTARERLELIDRWLTSHHGLLFWLGVIAATMLGAGLAAAAGTGTAAAGARRGPLGGGAGPAVTAADPDPAALHLQHAQRAAALRRRG